MPTLPVIAVEPARTAQLVALRKSTLAGYVGETTEDETELGFTTVLPSVRELPLGVTEGELPALHATIETETHVAKIKRLKF